ncbi:arylesterase [Fulvivirga sp. RKSG066]|uniref:arylesterase n=1 Tax=Fulvivirga aurantia TaxID=2529383 RepID=UPI0012BD7A7D|nr:arylesterase [Fulvivirga aurantia]MTI22009.1 arylesterase [Fulvivirga aurantia]
MSINKRIFFLVVFFISTVALSFKEQTTTILFFGDSLTAGYGLSKEQAFPHLIEQALNDKGHNVEVINAGLSGETSAGGLNRIDWVLKKPIDIFVLELGANDGLRGLPVTQTKENLQAIIDKVKAKNPDVKIIITGMMVPPNLGQEYSQAFSAIFPELATKNDSMLIPFLLDGVAGDESLNLPDGIHPNVEGHKILADNVLTALKRII